MGRGSSVEERCPPKQKSRVERLKARGEPFLTEVTMDTFIRGNQSFFHLMATTITTQFVLISNIEEFV
jgi:hypothetical protein